MDDAIRRLRQPFGSEHADTEHELEKVVRAIYGVLIFSTASPEEIGTAYQTACEMAQWSPGFVRGLAHDGYGQFGAADPLARAGPDWSFAMVTAQQLDPS